VGGAAMSAQAMILGTIAIYLVVYGIILTRPNL
jgi:hypothetical protein